MARRMALPALKKRGTTPLDDFDASDEPSVARARSAFDDIVRAAMALGGSTTTTACG